MALADPAVVTIDGVAVTMPRQFTKNGLGTFISADGAYTLEVLPSNGKTKVRTVRLRNSKVTTSVETTQNVRVSDLISINIIRPLDGYTDAEVVKQVAGLFAFLTAGTNAILKQIVEGQN